MDDCFPSGYLSVACQNLDLLSKTIEKFEIMETHGDELLSGLNEVELLGVTVRIVRMSVDSTDKFTDSITQHLALRHQRFLAGWIAWTT